MNGVLIRLPEFGEVVITSQLRMGKQEMGVLPRELLIDADDRLCQVSSLRLVQLFFYIQEGNMTDKRSCHPDIQRCKLRVVIELRPEMDDPVVILFVFEYAQHAQ